MLILGIDPGCTTTGIGVIRSRRGRLQLVAGTFVRTRPATPMALRLSAIFDGVAAAIAHHEPDAVAIEAIFRHKSSESALRLGQARGVALLAAGRAGYEPFEYNPMTVKRSVGAHGRADKVAIARMVTMLLGVEPEGPADVTDALAIAITHFHHAHAHQRMIR